MWHRAAMIVFGFCLSVSAYGDHYRVLECDVEEDNPILGEWAMTGVRHTIIRWVFFDDCKYVVEVLDDVGWVASEQGKWYPSRTARDGTVDLYPLVYGHPRSAHIHVLPSSKRLCLTGWPVSPGGAPVCIAEILR